MMLAKGTRLTGPDGTGYEIVADWFAGASSFRDCFQPFGGAPLPIADAYMPVWLVRELTKRREEQA